MDCNWTEKVSQLLDEELSGDEALRVEEHLSACSVCSGAREDFLRVRREIKAYDFQLEPFANERALRDILASEKAPFWRRRIAVPVPAMATLLVLLLALGLWSASLRIRRPAAEGARVNQTTEANSQPEPGGAFDLSRFDHGERAAVIKIKREQSSNQ